ncbi:MAG TPA: hypothetical protein VGP72_14625 [Planctomycetota bacterium]|jgi:hypothetical protein
MTEAQRAAQIRAIVIEYKRQVEEGLRERLHLDIDESRKIWAYNTLGRVVPTFNVLKDWEVNLLRDLLNGKPNKMVVRAQELAPLCGVHNLDAWIAGCAEKPSFEKWRGHTLATLPAPQVYRLVKTLETRGERRPSGAAREADARRCTRPPYNSRAAVRVEREQNELWGM